MNTTEVKLGFWASILSAIFSIIMFVPDNLNGIFNALANSYVYMALSMFFVGFVFSKGRQERWIKGLLLAQIVTAIGQVGYSMFDISTGIFIITSMVWVIGAPVAFILMAFWFRSLRIQINKVL